MRLLPCLHCRHRDGCAIRERVAASARTLPPEVRRGGLTWNCAERNIGLEPGTVCEVSWRGADDQGFLTDELAEVVVMAHRKNGRAVVWIIDPCQWEGANMRALEAGKRVVTFKHSDLRPTGETIALCADCRRPLDAPEPENPKDGGRHVCEAYELTGSHRPAGWDSRNVSAPERTQIKGWQTRRSRDRAWFEPSDHVYEWPYGRIEDADEPF